MSKMTKRELEALKKEARPVFEICVREYAQLIGVTYGTIHVRAQKSVWGSCSGKGNLNFNCLLLKTPPRVLRYVVVHELCHRIEMNHSKAFWANVERIMPDYRESREWLKKNGGNIIGMLPN